MPEIQCPSCNTVLPVETDFIGQHVRCTACNTKFLLTEAMITPLAQEPSAVEQENEPVMITAAVRVPNAPKKRILGRRKGKKIITKPEGGVVSIPHTASRTPAQTPTAFHISSAALGEADQLDELIDGDDFLTNLSPILRENLRVWGIRNATLNRIFLIGGIVLVLAAIVAGVTLAIVLKRSA